MIVERPERLRALKVGFAAAIARLEEERRPIASSLTEGFDDSKRPVDAADELTKALDNLNIAPKPPATVTDICNVSLLPVTLQYLSSDPAVRMIHAANADGDGYDNMEHLDRLAKWARESEEKIKETGSEIPVGFSQGDLYSKLRYIPQPQSFAIIWTHRKYYSTVCPQSYSAICGAVEAVRVAVDQVMRAEKPASAFAAVRPPGHHCGEDTPSGFCFVNNVAIAAAHGMPFIESASVLPDCSYSSAHLQHGVKRVIIFDIDLHHGKQLPRLADCFTSHGDP
jgi:histone deacetylase HOS3